MTLSQVVRTRLEQLGNLDSERTERAGPGVVALDARVRAGHDHVVLPEHPDRTFDRVGSV